MGALVRIGKIGEMMSGGKSRGVEREGRARRWEGTDCKAAVSLRSNVRELRWREEMSWIRT